MTDEIEIRTETQPEPTSNFDRDHEIAEINWCKAMLANARDMIPSHIKNGYQMRLILGYGRELGIPDLTALQEIGVIHGKIVMSAKLQMALVRQRCPRARINVIQCDGEASIIEVQRYPADAVSRIEFNLDDAKKAGLTRDNWQKYPADMLWARCVSRVCRRIFPDVTLGAYAPEDLQGEPDDKETVRIEVVE